jgi:GT2 family glycosyltransferase
VSLIASATNLGFGPAVNLVAQRTDSPWIAAANADVELTEGALSRLLDAGARAPEAGIIAPRLVLPDGTTQHSVHPFPTLGFTLAFNLGLAGLHPLLADRLTLEGSWNPERSRTVDWAIGAFVMIRRSTWEAIGGFDAGQWMYAEDLDLGWRAARAGWPTRFEASAVVRHHDAAATSLLWGEARQRQWLRSTYAWMLRRRGLPVTRAYALLNSAGALARLALLSGPALARGGEARVRWRSMRTWSRLHLANLLTSRATLERHR